MKRLKNLNSVVREYNGLLAKWSKERSPSNREAVDECLRRMKQEINEVCPD